MDTLNTIADTTIIDHNAPEEPPYVEATAGAQLFVRYAYPPNALGYCGPADSRALLQYGASGEVDQGLVQLAQAFHGAWPYLELISTATGIRDPLDRRVVEAYWVGNELLPNVGLGATAASMEERFRPRTGRQFPHLLDGVLAGGVPHHSFHVFGVYPWVGLLGDDRKAPQALDVLERCRIRWGRVERVDGDRITVTSRPLTWDGIALALGPPRTETALRSMAGIGYLGGIRPGDWVSLHWDWVCDRLTARQLRALRFHTLRQMEITNRTIGRNTVATVLAN
ncbi:hypothetical protein KGA66_00405 [Actinocrinis puniceicyclus]|uniref:Uncharacterized protein n=1 Tax=Actinocrinis puniceicyclus TaxID=977794 RepID=A0A8J7WL38_9ACTN|nr:DUF6390 family protein [Actinocrinis puniceicyclus]MBS2961485.1 hypothetical protein [Actinocrinis puniceicyclus]